MHNNKMRRFVSLFLSVLILAAFPLLSAVTTSAEVIGLRAGEAYYLRNVATGKYMDVYNQEKTNGTNILLFGFNGQNNQRFTVVHKGNGIYRLRPKHASGYTMDVTGSNVDIWQEGSYASEDFTIVRNLSSQYPGSYYIKYGSKYVMSNADENNVVVADTSTYDSKALWSFEKVTHGDADIFSTRYTSSEGHFDTTGADSHILNCVENRMGYYGTTNINPSIGSVTEALFYSDIVVCFSHGDDGGVISFYNGSGVRTGYLSGSQIANLQSNRLSSLRLFIVCGCKTGNTSPEFGNLINSAFSKGAHFSIGWTEDIGLYSATHWLKSFFDKIGDKGATVQDARDHAEYWSHCGGIYYKGDLSQQLSHLK